LGLHVFSYNAEAIALYNNAGYDVTGQNMQKNIST
jgi:hypothetical protein